MGAPLSSLYGRSRDSFNFFHGGSSMGRFTCVDMVRDL